MTAPAREGGWGQRHDAARDEAWVALRRTGVDPFELAFTHGGIEGLEGLRSMTRIVTDFGLPVLDQLDVRLSHEARERVLTEAAIGAVRHVPWALVKAIADELARPEPMPFDPPPAGAWIRSRRLPRAFVRSKRLVPEWDGAWHVFSGDLVQGDPRSHGVAGRSRCGRRVTLRSFGMFDDGRQTDDYVLVTEQPTVDACRRCARIVEPA